MKTDGPVPVWHEGVYHDRVVRHVSSSQETGLIGTVRIDNHVWSVRCGNNGYLWQTTGLSIKSYFGGGRNARLLKGKEE